MRILYLMFAALFLPCSSLLAEQADQKLSEKRMQTMRGIARDMDVSQIVEGKAFSLPLIERPLTHYNDPSRRFEDGTLWGFGKKDERPQVLVTCYTKDATEGSWIHAITSLSEHPIEARFNGRLVWNPKKSELKLSAIPGAGEPRDFARVRLAQMRKLARRFKSHHFWDPNNSQFELRLLSGNVARYSDKRRGVVDGSIFLFARNINPELCLLIESVEKAGSQQWQFGVVKIGSAEFHVELDGKEVWMSPRAPGVVGRASDPYAMFFSRRPITAVE